MPRSQREGRHSACYAVLGCPRDADTPIPSKKLNELPWNALPLRSVRNRIEAEPLDDDVTRRQFVRMPERDRTVEKLFQPFGKTSTQSTGGEKGA